MHVYKRKSMWGHSKEAIYKPRRETSEETKPADTLILDFSLQNCEKISFCSWRHRVCGSPSKLIQYGIQGKNRLGVGRREESQVSTHWFKLFTHTGMLSCPPPARLSQVPSGPPITPYSLRDLSLPGTRILGQKVPPTPPRPWTACLVLNISHGCLKGERFAVPFFTTWWIIFLCCHPFSFTRAPAHNTSYRIEPQ